MMGLGEPTTTTIANMYRVPTMCQTLVYFIIEEIKT